MTNEALVPQVDQLLPRLDSLNDHEYLEVSRLFGQHWYEFTAGEIGEEAGGLFRPLGDIYESRASN
jgi:hypothetical protein